MNEYFKNSLSCYSSTNLNAKSSGCAIDVPIFGPHKNRPNSRCHGSYLTSQEMQLFIWRVTGQVLLLSQYPIGHMRQANRTCVAIISLLSFFKLMFLLSPSITKAIVFQVPLVFRGCFLRKDKEIWGSHFNVGTALFNWNSETPGKILF